MPIVPTNKYPRELNEIENYKYISGNDISIDVPFDGLPSDAEISITVFNTSDGCSVIKGYNIQPEVCVIPKTITSRFSGNLSCYILIRDKTVNKNKIVKVGLNER